MRKIGTIHLEQNEGIQLCDPIYLGDKDNIRIPLNWPKGDYPVFYQEEGFLCILKSAKIEDVFWPISGLWGEMSNYVVVDSGNFCIAPSLFHFDDDSHKQHFHARSSQIMFGEDRQVKEAAFVIENVAIAITAEGDGEYPVFLDDADNPVLIAIDTETDTFGDEELEDFP